MKNTDRQLLFFLRVTDVETKIQRIVKAVAHHFASGDSLIIYVPSEQAAVYLDTLLWTMPKESFIPHRISHEKSQDKVVITQKEANLNDAQVALNLKTEIIKEPGSFRVIYELWDQTDPKKTALSEKKKEHYQALGLYPVTG